MKKSRKINESACGASGNQGSGRTGFNNLPRIKEVRFEGQSEFANYSVDELMEMFVPQLRQIVERKTMGKNQVTRDARHKILELVSRLDDYATASNIHGVWDEIVTDAQLGATFFYKKGGKKIGTPLITRLIAIIGYLRNKGCYDDKISLLEYSMILQNVEVRTQEYDNHGNYSLKENEERRLINIIRKNHVK